MDNVRVVRRRFGDYEILSELGAGGTGRVYLAQDTRLPRRVAIKTLAPDSVRSEDGARRFEQEAWAASSLNHPNILTIYEVGRYEGEFFIAAEYVEGVTLRQNLSARLPVSAVLDIAIQAATGLHAAHAAGIVHRDIKPENLMIRHDGLLKIVDFGLARVAARSRATVGAALRENQTEAGMVLGTTKYMSPEQARGLPVDARTDLFSLGAVLYEMLSGRAPFSGETDSDRIAAILLNHPEPLRKASPTAPAELVRIVERAMAKEADRRYQSAAELLGDLQSAQHALAQKGDGAKTRRWHGFRNKPLTLALIFVSVGLAIAFFALLRWKTSPPEASAGHPLSLAILPFRNLTRDPDSDFLGFSLADAIISKFGYVSSVAVRPSSAVEKYRNRSVDPQQAGRELNARDLLTGNYLRDGDRLRINVQLIDVAENRVLWHDTLDTPYQDLFRVHDEVAQRIIHQLQLHLTSEESQRVQVDTPIGREAYEDYLRGVDLYGMNDFSGAITALEKSASLDSKYALTWAHLGQAYTTSASLEFGGTQQYRKAQRAYEKALSLNPALMEAQVYMANLFTDTGRVEQSVPLLRAALARNPNSADAHWELGYAYRFAGMLPESLRECLLARQIDPQVKLYSSAINTYLYVGEYDQFLASLPESRSVYLLFYRGFAELYKGQNQAALSYFDEAFDLNPSLLQAKLGEAFADSLRNRNAEGVKLMRETAARVEERGVTDPEGLYKLAQAFAAVGDRSDGVKAFTAAIRGGFFPYPYLRADPLIQPLRNDGGFAAAMEVARRRHEHFQALFFGSTK